ncbi:MAG: hypothetical protein EXR29_00880 [Betaproteobacteria bacterium]|nr:hypothetical protein [Betaproteobacteria bacterium]
MELNSRDPTAQDANREIPQEHLVYAAWLDVGTKIGLGLLIATFALYVSGILPSHIAFSQLPHLWTLPVDRYLAASALPSGWGWLALLGRGDMLNFAGIVFLSLVTLGCYLRLAVLLVRRGDVVFCLIALAEIGVLALAASGLVSGGH